MRPDASPPAAHAGGAAPWAAPAGFFAATLGLLLVFRVHASLHLDTARDLLIARDCTIGRHCPEAGPRSSFVELMHGALWSHVLEVREVLGLGIAAVELIVVLALALAAALVPVAARRLGRSAGGLTWALWFPAALATSGYPTLWNPSLWPLALAIFTLALLHAARVGGVVACALAAASLALAVDLHVSSALLFPVLVAVIGACARRPLPAVIVAGGVAAFVLAVDSPKGFAENRAIAGEHALGLAVALAGSLAGGLCVRRRLLAAPAEWRATRVAAGLCSSVAVLLPALAWLSGHALQARYLAPAVVPAAILLGGRFEGSRRLRRAAVVVAVAGYVVFWANDRIVHRRFRVVEAEALAGELHGRGLAFGDLYRRVRGPQAFDLVSTLAAFEPPDGRVAGGEGPDLRILRAAPGDLPEPLPVSWRVVALGTGRVAVIAESPAWVRSDPLTLCHAGACEVLTMDVARFAQREGMVWADRAHAGIRPLPRGQGEVSLRMPLRAPAGAGRRELRLLADECVGWRIAASDGAVSAAEDRVIVEAPVAGEVVFSVVPGSRCRGWLPPFIELGPEDGGLAGLL